jgi:aryl-alcohol dehydrogenase-like predicted oxidoreductase
MRNPESRYSRRDAAALLAGAALCPPGAALAQADAPLLKRPIPHGNGEMLPAVGVGTSQVFEVGASAQERAGPTAVVRALIDHGGTIIDTAPSYGEAEVVIGDILASTGLRPKAFIATKLEEYRPGGMLAEAQDCLKRLRTSKLDLLQLHNVRDPGQDMGGLNALKAQGLCRYTGVTTTFENDYSAVEAVVRRARPDFLEIDYAIDNREAEQRLFPAARDAGAGIFVALPFGRGRLFRAALGKALPDWAAEFDCTSWAQFFLKFTLSHPEIIAVIPGTDKPAHMIDNLGAARGRLPDAAMRTRMIKYVESL